jgi:hypothetical protein
MKLAATPSAPAAAAAIPPAIESTKPIAGMVAADSKRRPQGGIANEDQYDRGDAHGGERERRGAIPEYRGDERQDDREHGKHDQRMVALLRARGRALLGELGLGGLAGQPVHLDRVERCHLRRHE